MSKNLKPTNPLVFITLIKFPNHFYSSVKLIIQCVNIEPCFTKLFEPFRAQSLQIINKVVGPFHSPKTFTVPNEIVIWTHHGNCYCGARLRHAST